MPTDKPRNLDEDLNRQARISDDELDRMMAASFGQGAAGGAGPTAPTPLFEDTLESGSEVNGRITSVDVEIGEVYVELGKDIGVVPLSEFGGETPSAGDQLRAVVKRFDKRKEQYVLEVGELLRQAFIESAKVGDTVSVRIMESNRGGLVGTTQGQRIFIPISQIELHRVEDLKPYSGELLEVEITQVDGGRGEIVGSRRRVLERDREKVAAVRIRSLRVGEKTTGTVARVTAPGVFIDLGGFDGLLPRREMQRVGKTDDDFVAGRVVDIEITSVDVDARRVSLAVSSAAIASEEFAEASADYQVGEKITALVSRVRDEGAYLLLESDLEGFLPIEQLRADPVRPGQLVESVVVSIDSSNRRVLLKR